MQIRKPIIKQILKAAGVLVVFKFLQTLLSWWRKVRFLKAQKDTVPVASELTATPWEGVKNFAINMDRVHDFRLDLLNKYTNNFKGSVKSITGCGILFGFRPMVITVDEVIIKHILKDNFDNYLKLQLGFEEVYGQNLLTVDHGPYAPDKGAFYKYQRRTSSKLFTERKLSGLVGSAIQRQTGGIIKNIQMHNSSGSKTGFPMKESIFTITFNVMCEVVLGYRPEVGETQSIYQESFNEVSRLAEKLLFDPLWKLPLSKYYVPSKILIMKHKNIITEFFNEAIDASLLEDDETRSRRGDLLSMFIGANKDNQYTREQLNDLMLLFIAAGRDTSAATIQWILYYISIDPALQEELLEQTADTVSYDKDSGEIHLDSESIKHNMFLDGAVMEALRLHPPFSFHGKVAARDDTLPNGMQLQAGSYVMYDAAAMGRNPQKYPEPDKFMPSRWMSTDRKPETFDEYAFPVFLGGPRVCIGKGMAFRQIKMVVVSLIHKFKFTLHQNELNALEKRDVLYKESSIHGYAGDLLVNATERINAA